MSRTLLVFLVAAVLQGQTPELPRQRSLKYERERSREPAAAPVPRGYALVIGVGNYRNLQPEQNLRFAEADAERIARVLGSKDAGNIEPENLVKLIGPDATRAKVQDAIENWLPKVVNADDRVIVYFVGHGLADPSGRGYLAPYDVDPANAYETSYPMDRLSEYLGKRVHARWKVLLLDACHSGKVTPSSTDESINTASSKLPRNFLTFTSSREGESSYEHPALGSGAGLFTYFLAKGWEGEADTDPADGIVTADELITYVQREVRAYARAQGHSFQQNPTERGDFANDWVLGFRTTLREGKSAIEREVPNGTLVVEVNLEDVEIYVDGDRAGVASPGKPLHLPGLAAGMHTVRGVRAGYQPAVRDVSIHPGGDNTIQLRILYTRSVKPSAKADYEQATKIWAESHARRPELQNAARLYGSALKQQPDYAEASLGLCRVLQQLEETEQARAACRRAVQIDPDLVEARTMYGAVLNELGDGQEAVAQLSLAAEQNPSDAYAHSLYAEALYLVERFETAEQEATRSIGIDPEHGQGYLLRGEARRARGNFDGAIADYRMFLDLVRFDSGTLRKIAFYTIGTGMKKHRAGRQALHRTQHAAALFGLCSSELGRNNFRRAIDYCRVAAQIDSEDPDIHIQLGEAYLGAFNREAQLTDLAAAKFNLKRALAIDPDVSRAPGVKRQLREIAELYPQVK
jgi:tetratricopeptide (TPR) repeat protein